jgi:hypothetical protein
VLIKKNEDYARRLPWGSAWLWYGFFGKLIGYSYRPLRAFCISLALIFLGWFFFHVAYKSGVIVPTDEKAYTVQRNGLLQVSRSYPKFNSFIYSLESFVPIFKFGLAESVDA